MARFFPTVFAPSGPATGGLRGTFPGPSVEVADGAVTGLFAINTAIDWDSAILAIPITGDVNDFSPTGLATGNFIRLAATGATRRITGIVAPSPATHQTIKLFNFGPETIVLSNEDAGSVAANQFRFGADITLLINQSVELWYDSIGSTLRWRAVSNH